MIDINSLAPAKFKWNFGYAVFKQILVTDGWGISCEIALIWMSLDFTDDESTLVQVMVWCRQAPSHYLRQCWPRSLSPYGVTRPEWVKLLLHYSLRSSGHIATCDYRHCCHHGNCVGILYPLGDMALILTHLPLDKMAAISQMIFSYTFSWIKSSVFWKNFHWSLFIRVQLTITQPWFR